MHFTIFLHILIIDIYNKIHIFQQMKMYMVNYDKNLYRKFNNNDLCIKINKFTSNS